MIKKIFFKKNIIPFLILLVSLNMTYAQSIGATPKQTIEVKTNTVTIADFGISQGSDYPEKITIEGDYDWLAIDETEFILESKSGKTIKLNITVKKPGTYNAILKICGSPITPEGAALSTKACTHHNLTVNATLDSKTKELIITIAATILLLLLFSLVNVLKVQNKRKHKR